MLGPEIAAVLITFQRNTAVCRRHLHLLHIFNAANSGPVLFVLLVLSDASNPEN